MTTQDENRANWKAKVEYLRTMDCSVVDPIKLREVQRAIRRCPYPNVSDAMMRINGGWLSGPDYDLCLAALLQADCLEPSGFGSFLINRRKLPWVDVENVLLDFMEAATRPEAEDCEPDGESDCGQWGLFA